MVEIINSLHKVELEEDLVDSISKFYDEVRELLPELPETIQIYFDNEFLQNEIGVGGFAYDYDIITISFDENFSNKELQRRELRGIIFHESYHLAHGFYAQKPAKSPLHIAVYEGAAGVFQRDIAGIERIGSFNNDAEMTQWYEKVKPLDNNFDWYKWKVYDEESGKHAILYALGTYIIDRAIRLSKMSILDLRHKSADEILKLANLEN
jgi:hypothetical protein